MLIIKLDSAEMRGKQPIIKPTSGTWIAGGAIRQWFDGEESASDIDVFGADTIKLGDFVKSLGINFKEISKTPITTSYSDRKTLVQVMFGKTFVSVEDTFKHFDFNLCQFAWDGTDIFSTKEAVISVLRKHLSVNNIQKEFAVDSLRRAFKYHSKGYKPCNGTLRDIAQAFVNITKEDIENQVVISPNGGRRMIMFD